MPQRKYKYLRPEDIKTLDSYEFAPKAIVEGYLSGRHQSRSQGPSTEFRDYREYVPGDDPRQVDWRVYARTERFYLRTYDQETNMNGYVLLDSSASMDFGEPVTKLEYASFFTAALCYLILRNKDRVALELFDDSIRTFIPPGSTGRHLTNLMHVLEDNRPGSRTSLAEALTRSYPLFRQRGVLIVVSDFFDDAAAIFKALSPYLHQGFKIVLFHVLDPLELDLPDRGLLSFVDMETNARVTAHTGELREAYRAEMQKHIQALREMAVRRRVEYCVARTDTPFYKLFDVLTT